MYWVKVENKSFPAGARTQIAQFNVPIEYTITGKIQFSERLVKCKIKVNKNTEVIDRAHLEKMFDFIFSVKIKKKKNIAPMHWDLSWDHTIQSPEC